MRRFVIFALVLSSIRFAAAAQNNPSCPDGKKHCRATVRHIEKGGIGYDKGYTTLEAFLAPDPSLWRVTPFLDGRGHVFDNGKWAANAGVGARALWGNRAYGINAYYDYRNTGRLRANQIGVGIETLGELFDFRLNGYLPLGTKTSAPYDTAFGTFSGHSLLLSEKIQSAMRGANGEFGFHFWETENFDFYAAAGPYYFIGESAPTTWGGKGRILATFKDILSLEISDSYDRTFHNQFQGEIALSFSFGPKSKVPKGGRTCKGARRLSERMVQPVDRLEIIVIDKVSQNSAAINPATGLPYYFIFVDNTSSSDGTYESPYHTLLQAQENSSPNDIIYVFPGDGTTTGMDSGITLKASQKLWGSGISHTLQTTQGTFSIPAQSSTAPIITNTNVDTELNAITLATNNTISGFTIASAMHDAIYGTDPQSLEVTSCTFQNTTTFPIEATFPGAATISITNNQFLDNVNGIFLTLQGTSTLTCSNNSFQRQTSVSSVPLEIVAEDNSFTAQIENNVFNESITGAIRFGLTHIADADITILNNTITNNGTGSQASLGSSVTFILDPVGAIDDCSLVLENNTFSDNTSNALYLHTSGTFTTLEVIASNNTIADIGGSGLVLATPIDTLTFLATNNRIIGCDDNGIAVISSPSTTGSITISGNTISDIGNTSNGIAINRDFSNLELTISNNAITGCEGTGIISYAPTASTSFTLDISDNTITGCDNLSSNASSGIDIEQYINLTGSISDNTLSDNAGTPVVVASTQTEPRVCLTLTGNDNTADYTLTNPDDGVFNLSPCDVDSVNVGTINRSDTVNLVQSCPTATPCSP